MQQELKLKGSANKETWYLGILSCLQCMYTILSMHCKRQSISWYNVKIC